jgi:hypothetical protein
MNIDKIKFMNNDKDDYLCDYVQSILNNLPIYDVFNPSFYLSDNVKVVSFRAVDKNDPDKELLSYLSVDSDKLSIYNISKDWQAKLLSPRLIDPKIFKVKDEIYVTFNSGREPIYNKIFIMKVFPKLERPKRVMYKHRKNQERNWAFFSEGGDIFALYWLNPLRILRLKEATDKRWIMEDYYREAENKSIPNDITMGTQLEKIDDKYCFVGHRKVFLKRKKIYLGKFGLFDFNNKNVHFDKYWLSHSLKSLFGEDSNSNTNLLSCTYFSGIQNFGGHIKLGYGINDIDLGFSKWKI